MRVRLNKFISECGIASRRKSEEFIKEGRVNINGKIITDLSFFVDEENDLIKIDGERIKPQKKIYYLLNKPKGFITTTSDEKGRKTVTDLIPSYQKIFPVGRLDYDTTGVLLLTNDGDFTNFITHPSNKIPREYFATLDKKLEDDDKQKLVNGIRLDGRKSRFEKVFVTGQQHDKVKVTTVEGRNHFVKRMFGVLGYRVEKLERTLFGQFNVKNMPSGSYRKLSSTEIEDFYKTYGK